MKTAPMNNAIAELGRALRSANPVARRAAVRELGELGPQARPVVPLLRQALHDADDLVRARAARALGLMGPAALTALLEALQHRDRHVRREATWALQKLGTASKQAVTLLTLALRDADQRVRLGAATALGVLGPKARPAIPQLIQALGDSSLVLCRLAAKALVHIGPAALPALYEALHSKDGFVRREASWAISHIERAAAGCPLPGQPAKDLAIRAVPSGSQPRRNGGVAEPEPANDFASTPATAVLQVDAALARHQVTSILPNPEQLARDIAAIAREN